jgi:hypothetical protein
VASARVRILGAVLIVAAPLAFAEAGLALLPWIVGRGLRSIVYVPPRVTREEYERYLAIRDPVTGWPRRGEGDMALPTPRPSPAFPEPREWCVTLYGESMTRGDDVSDAEAWGNVLAERLGCAVGNFGIGGYGTDQALLRFIANTADRAPATIVGIYTDNLLRNVNQYRYFLTGGETLALKPRFVLDDGTLELIPLSSLSYEQFSEGIRDPRTIFPHEAFVPGSRHGPVIWSFPYTPDLLRLILTDQVINYVRGLPSWINFYRLDHDTRALQTTVAIVEEFRRHAGRGRTVTVALHPSPASYDLARRTGASAFDPLATELRRVGIPVRDLTTDFAAYLGERTFCELLVRPAACWGHYNPEGNRVVASAMQAFLASAVPANVP